MENKPAKLVLRNETPGIESEYPLGDSITVGRHPSNKIVLGTDSISRFHARVDKRGEFFILQDLNSSNGSYVNGERVTQMTLHHNDEVTFGAVAFTFDNPASAEARASAEFEVGGMSIVEFKDDSDEPDRPTTKSVIGQDQIDQLRERSSFITTPMTEQKAKTFDHKTLVRVHNRLSALFKLSELLRTCEEEKQQVIVERVLDIVFEAVEADRGVVMTRFSPESTELEIAGVKCSDAPIPGTRLSISRTILDQVLRDRVSILSSDTGADDRFEASESIIMNKIHSVICVPMVQGDRVMGVLHLDTQSVGKSLDKEDLEFVTMIANDLSLALENMRMRREAAHRARLAAVGETVAGISHNIKNILLLMDGGKELLRRALDNDNLKNAKDSWGVVDRGINRISALVKDMLAYSSNKRPRLTQFDVNDAICSTAEEIEEELVKKNIMLELDLEEEVGERWGDEPGLQRTLANLIVNSIEAIKHSEGRIHITTAVLEDESLLLKLVDNGEGIPAEKLDKVFVPFFTTKGSTGTGLGLPMCKKCVEDLHGTMDVESEIGTGTTFTIILPKLTEEEAMEFGADGENVTKTDE